MARLSDLGALALGVGDGQVSVNGLEIDRGGEVCWFNHDTVMYQKVTDLQSTIAQYRLSDGLYTHVDNLGANFLRAGGNVWAAFLVPTVRTSWGAIWPDTRLCDVSDRGEVVICPLDQNHLFIYQPGDSAWATSLATGPLGQDATAGINVRLRQGLVLYQSYSGWGLYDTESHEYLDIAPRIETVDYAVPIRLGNEPWLLERANGRLTLRPASETFGYELVKGETYAPDCVLGTSGDQIVVGWSRSIGEPLGAGQILTQSTAMVRIDLNAIDPTDIVEPVIPSYGRFLYTGAVDASSEQYGYYSTPGNCEIIVRDADLEGRWRLELPVIAVWQVAELVPPNDLLGVWHDSGGASGPIADARRVADLKDRPVFVYYDGRETPPPHVLDQVRSGDGLAVNGYPRENEDPEATVLRVEDTVRDVQPQMFVRPLYTQSGHWNLQDILDLQAPYTTLLGQTASVKVDAWFACAPEARGGMLMHDELMRVGEGLEAAVVGEPDPENEAHMAAYGQPIKGFLPGTLESHPQGAAFRAVRMANGKVLCCTPDGNLEERTDKGGWEAFELSANGSSLLATRDKNGTKLVYVLPWA